MWVGHLQGWATALIAATSQADDGSVMSSATWEHGGGRDDEIIPLYF